jgi:prevent-host-death family protein
MRERRIGIRDLKSKLSECIRDVEAGATVVVTDHGRQVARIVPEADSVEHRLAVLRATGAFLWSGRRLGVTKPDVHVRGEGSVSEIAIENRG